MGKKRDRVKLDSPEAFAKAAERIGCQPYYDEIVMENGSRIRVLKDINIQHIAVTANINEDGTIDINYPEEEACVKKSPTVTPK